MEIKKSAGQIIRDDVKRKRLKWVGLCIFFGGILLMLGITHFNPRGGDVAGYAGLLSLVVSLLGFAMYAASAKCPICDSPIYKSGACKCQPGRAARSAYIDDLNWRVGSTHSGGDTNAKR